MPVVGVLLALLVLTQKRAAWAGAVIILMTYAGWVERRYLLGLLVIPFLLLIPSVSERIPSSVRGVSTPVECGATPTNSILCMAGAYVGVCSERCRGHTIIGQGPVFISRELGQIFPLPLPEGGMDAHSGFVQSIYENGYVGFLGLLFMQLQCFMEGLDR